MMMATLLAVEDRFDDELQPRVVAQAFPRPRRRSWVVPVAAAATVLIATAVWRLSAPNHQRTDRVTISTASSHTGSPAASPEASEGRSGPPVSREIDRPAAAPPPAPGVQADRNVAGTRPESASPSTAPAPPAAKTEPLEKSTDERVPNSPSVAAAQASAPQAEPRRDTAAALSNQIFAAGAAGPVEVRSPDGSVRWRIAQGVVQKSADAGVSWQPVTSIASAGIRAGTAPSSTTCWLAGSNGQVFLTIDGNTWTRIRFPEALELTAVTATDALSAVVTAAGGRRFETRDGGASWTERQ
jgi:hypothetical protein